MNHQQIAYYRMSVEETLHSLGTQTDGLAAAESQQRLLIYGKNKLVAAHKDFFILKLLRQFKDLMVIILIVAGSLSFYMDDFHGGIIMFMIVAVNAFISFIQEYKAEKVMNSLKMMIATKAKVIRDGREIEIASEEVIPGDIICIEEGDAVPADLRIFTENNLSTNDFALTGESNPTRKFTHPISAEVQIGDRNNLAFMGTTVATGNACGVAVATGMQTEIGRIANLSQKTPIDESPLQMEMNHLAKTITLITLVIGVVLFMIALGANFTLRDAFIFAVGVAACMVPEGLPAEVSVALSLAAGRLAKQKAVVRKLSTVETLGATHIICTDKTGTLTKNEMTVQKIIIGKEQFTISGLGYEPKGDILDAADKVLTKKELLNYQLFFETGIFASNARISPPDDNHGSWYAIGDPTEAALISLGEKTGLSQMAMDKQYPEMKEFSFDAGRKCMTSIHKKDGKVIAYVKGSSQSILERATKILDGQTIRPITEEDKDFFRKKDDEFASEALRNLAYAYKELPDYRDSISMQEAESDLILLGLVAMIDPPRAEVKAAMEIAQKAHIRVIIITGDYALTAAAIAKKIGMAGAENKELTVVTGQEVKSLSDIELVHKLIYSNLIFARTSPEDKLRIVELLKKAGEIVAVTGDGVNDSPALKKADVGVAMGKTGTEVAKDSAEIILLDDSFGTLVAAVKEGRTIYQNIKKTIFSSLVTNTGELVVVLLSLAAASLFDTPLAILTLQILAIDLVGQLLPITSLTWDPPLSEIMTESPRNPSEHILSRKTLLGTISSGLVMGIIAYANFIWLFERYGVSASGVAKDATIYMQATTLTYVTLVVIAWMNIMARRAGDKSVFSSYAWSNPRLLLSYVVSLLLLMGVVYLEVPARFLGTAPLTLNDWLYAFAGGIVYLLIFEVSKLIRLKYAFSGRAAAVVA